MARTPMVTRTITSTVAKILCVNTETKSVEEVEKTFPRTYNDESALMKYIEKNGTFLGTTLKPVSIVSTEVQKAYYGMTEVEFIQHAKPITKAEADEATTDNDDAPVDEKPKKSKK